MAAAQILHRNPIEIQNDYHLNLEKLDPIEIQDGKHPNPANSTQLKYKMAAIRKPRIIPN